MNDNSDSKFEILRLLAIKGAGSADMVEATKLALEQAANYVGLSAAAIIYFDDSMNPTSTSFHAESDSHQIRLMQLEEQLYRSLRQKQNLSSAYMSFDGDPPTHSFTLPLKYGGSVFGALIGLQEGERNLLAEESFLEAFTAMLALVHYAGAASGDDQLSRERIAQERKEAILETSVAVNHEINNPLTAILGIVQLLLMKREDMDADLKDKLTTVEASALRIRDVTQRLRQITNPRTKDYADGKKMLDLSDESDESDQ